MNVNQTYAVYRDFLRQGEGWKKNYHWTGIYSKTSSNLSCKKATNSSFQQDGAVSLQLEVKESRHSKKSPATQRKILKAILEE